MTLRIILSVKGSLDSGGAYGGAFASTPSSNTNSKAHPGNVPHQLSSGFPNRHSVSHPNPSGYTVDQIQGKGPWATDGGSDDGKSGFDEAPPPTALVRSPYGEKAQLGLGEDVDADVDGSAFARAKKAGGIGVKVTVDRDRQF